MTKEEKLKERVILLERLVDSIATHLFSTLPHSKQGQFAEMMANHYKKKQQI